MLKPPTQAFACFSLRRKYVSSLVGSSSCSSHSKQLHAKRIAVLGRTNGWQQFGGPCMLLFVLHLCQGSTPRGSLCPLDSSLWCDLAISEGRWKNLTWDAYIVMLHRIFLFDRKNLKKIGYFHCFSMVFPERLNSLPLNIHTFHTHPTGQKHGKFLRQCPFMNHVNRSSQDAHCIQDLKKDVCWTAVAKKLCISFTSQTICPCTARCIISVVLPGKVGGHVSILFGHSMLTTLNQSLWFHEPNLRLTSCSLYYIVKDWGY